jgi:hypothetical protein
LLLALSTCAFMACDKDKNDDPDTPPGPGSPTIEDFAPLAIGNYWVYERYQSDSLGNETLTTETDSVAVVGDTIANDNIYFVLQGTHSLVDHQPYRSMVRDSADCLVSIGGGTIFSLSGLGEVMWQATIQPNGTMTWITDPATVQHTVPAGTWTCYDMQGTAMLPGYPTRVVHRFRGEGIGLIEDQTVYLASGSGFRHKLAHYHLE